MGTRPFHEIAHAAKEKWTPEVKEFADRFGTELDEQVQKQVELGKQLASARAAAHLTQEQLAILSNIGQSEISRIERGLGNPTRDTLIRITTAMGAELTIAPSKHLENV